MSVTATRTVAINFTGDVVAQNSFPAASNTASPGQIDIVTLASGANTITIPAGGSTPKAVTIIPPSGNTTLITLKGISGDTGVALHHTDPTSIAIDSTVATFVLNAAAGITGVRLVWS